MISPRELRDALRRLGLRSVTSREVSQLISRFDLDKDGRISTEEFISILIPSKERLAEGDVDDELERLKKKNAMLERQLAHETALLELDGEDADAAHMQKLRAAEAKLRAHLAQLADTGKSTSTGKIDILRAFRVFDRNDDGSISASEFSRALSEMELLLDAEERRLLVDRFADKDRRISFDAFLDFFLNPKRDAREMHRNNIAIEDRVREDLRRMFAGKEWTGSKLRSAWAELDHEGFGSLTRQDFGAAMEKVSALLFPRYARCAF